MQQIVNYLKAMEQRNPDLKIKIQEPGFWRQCVISQLNWKYRHLGPDAVHRAMYQYLVPENHCSMEEYTVALHFPSKVRYVSDAIAGWQYCNKEGAHRFLSVESAQQFIETMDDHHIKIARVEKL
jgi:hypothetical protein